jgi:23S rRNA (cytidine1920-2'-O)/16S rRNA (cytidine1409-2'-O)-methyltransferase
VSRAGDKLDAAFEEFEIDVNERTAIDIGASTGGFTDCLLSRGVATVVAVDVGYGQLDWKLRSDDRVTVMDRTNARHIDAVALGAPFGVIVADVSFISLTKIMEKLAALGDRASDWVMLVKPQFEAGPDDVESGGVVTDPVVRDRCIQSVVEAAAEYGLECQGGLDSPVPGAKSGNVEHLAWFRQVDNPTTQAQ